MADSDRADYEDESQWDDSEDQWAALHASAAEQDGESTEQLEEDWAQHARTGQQGGQPIPSWQLPDPEPQGPSPWQNAGPQPTPSWQQPDPEPQTEPAAEGQDTGIHAGPVEPPVEPPAEPAAEPQTPQALPHPLASQQAPRLPAGQIPPQRLEQPVPLPSYRADELIQALPAHREAPAEKGVRAMLKMRPGTAERGERLAREMAATSFGRPVSIVVANPKGGAGKTPTTLLLAGGLGQARGGGVVAWDNNELRGNMHLRTHDTNPRATVTDMLQAMSMLTQPDARLGDVAAYLRHQVSGQYDVLTSATTTYAQIEAKDFAQIHRLLSRFYRVLVIDTGNNEGSSNWREAMKAADVLVIPIKWKSLSCAAAVQMLEELERQGPAAQQLIQRAVVCVSNGPGDVNKEVEKQLRPYFQSRAAAVVDIPTDPHIAEEGPLDHAALQPGTRRAALELAAKVAEQISIRLRSQV